MSAVGGVKPDGVYELRGGIERYIKTFPDGGYWKGKNYLFDRRMEQVPANKSNEQVEAETDSVCCRCRNKWTVYRGKFKCSRDSCGVPVIVCDACKPTAVSEPQSLLCDLCRAGYSAPAQRPDLVQLKRRAESTTLTSKKAKKQDEHEPSRLFISRLPLTVTKTKLAEWLGSKIELLQWLVDKKTGGFYGSCIVQVSNADQILNQSRQKLDGRKPKIVPAISSRDDNWPPADNLDKEYPPIGN